MKRKTKMLISSLSVLLIMAIGAAVISFSLANDNGANDQLDVSGSMKFADGSMAAGNTNIDNIIENALSDDADVDKIYHIVEIGAADAPSNLDNFIKTRGFKDYVIDGNRTIEKKKIQVLNDENVLEEKEIDFVIPEGCIEYTYFKASSVSNDDTESLAKISNADFVYVSQWGAKYSITNDIPEELYNILHEYAVGKYGPLMIDSPSKGGTKPSGPEDNTEKSIADLVNSIYIPLGNSYYTFGWDLTKCDATQFLAHLNGSMYLGINGDKKASSGNWIDLTKSGTDTFKMSKALVISKNGNTVGTGKMADKLFADAALVTLGEATDATPTDGAELPLRPVEAGVVVEGVVYDIKNAKTEGAAAPIMGTYGYNTKYTVPDYMNVTEVSLENVASVDLDNYDMIILETDCGTATVSKDIYNKLAAALYACNTIVYDKAIGTATTTPDDGDDTPARDNETNFLELYYMVATSDDVPRYDNIMITSPDELSIIFESNSVATCKVIADLINNSSYRGVGGPGASSNMYSVLEIQPCYPIDLELAKEIGKTNPRAGEFNAVYGNDNYYTSPADVVNGKTKEQLEGNTEYYAWELSKAKIADVTGLPASKINLKQMSVVELAANKDKILGNYDLVYIGGNYSAKKEATEYRGITTFIGKERVMSSWSGDIDLSKITELPIYTMYSHAGDLIKVDLSHMAYKGDTPFLNQEVVEYLGSNVSTFSTLSGYDLTYNNLQDLSAYVDAGMPIVISDDVYNAYNAVQDFGYKQNSMDPDCNMFKLVDKVVNLDVTNEQKGARKSTLLGFDKDGTVMVDNNGGDYGSTLTGFVSVFANSQEKQGTMDMEEMVVKYGERDKLESLLASSSSRPKLSLTKSPAIYNLYDKSTRIESKIPGQGATLGFGFKVTGTKNYTARLYIDDDGNSVFSEDEIMLEKSVKAKEGETISVSDLDYTLAETFFGPVYWKFEIVDNNNKKLSTYTTGLSYVKSKTNQKQLVKVLQILPGPEFNQAEGRGGRNSLWFCTVCQQGYQTLEYNPATSSQLDTYPAVYGGHLVDSADGTFNGIYLGKHEHDLGIVKFDSSMPVVQYDGMYGMDDWNSNLVDDISDLFEFDLDIMTVAQYEANSDEVAQAYNFSSMSDADIEEEINKNPISEDNKHYPAFAAISGTTREDNEARLRIVRMVKYEQLANKNWQLYQYMSTQKTKAGSSGVTIGDETISIAATTLDEKEKMEEVLDALYNNATASNVSSTFSSYTLDGFKDFIAEIKANGRYYLLYSLDTGKQCNKSHDNTILGGAVGKDGKALDFDSAFAKYVEAKDKELTYLELYRKYSRLANPNDWLLENYDTVLIGASEDFAGADISNANALANLVDYARNDGQILLFHDVLGKSADAGAGKGASNLTKYLEKFVGIDDHLSLDTSKLTDATVKSKAFDTVDYGIRLYDANGNKIIEKSNWNIPDMPLNAMTLALNIDIVDVIYNNGQHRWEPLSFEINTNPGTQTSDATDVAVTSNVKLTNRYVDGGYDGAPLLSEKEENLEGYSLEIFINSQDYTNKIGSKLDGVKVENGNTIFTGTISNGVVSFSIPNYEMRTYTASDKLYLPYKSDDPNKYFTTNLSTRTGDERYAAWAGDMSAVAKGTAISKMYYVPTAYTDSIMTTGINYANTNYAMPYRFAEMKWNIAAAINEESDAHVVEKGMYGTRKASQNNKGIVTMYPFTLSDQLNISGTHSQGYQVDLEDDNMTVWYSLAGGYNKSEYIKCTSSYYAADPLDGRNNYFIYSYGNVYNCGAGHAKITGALQDNNDERRLYLNILCNSVRKSARQPVIYLYDYGTEENETTIFRDASNEYYTKTEDVTAYPEFSFKVITDPSATLSRVKIYYELDYTEEDHVDGCVEDNDTDHILIADWSAPNVKENQRGDVYRYGTTNCPIEQPLYDSLGNQVTDTITVGGVESKVAATKLKLQERYFAKYNNEYTYIVIEATDSKGNKQYQRLKIKIKQHLFNLT